MVGHELDQKYLCAWARRLAAHPLSRGLYKLLGLSTLLSRKLIRARKQRRLDPSRPTKSLNLYHHISWLSLEALSILDADVHPHLRDAPAELRVLARKLNASYLHMVAAFGAESPPAREEALVAFRVAEMEARGKLPATSPLRVSVMHEFCVFLREEVRDAGAAAEVARRTVRETFAGMGEGGAGYERWWRCSQLWGEDAADVWKMVGELSDLAKGGEGEAGRRTGTVKQMPAVVVAPAAAFAHVPQQAAAYAGYRTHPPGPARTSVR